MFLPFIFVIVFTMWYLFGKLVTKQKKRRNFLNRVIGVASFLWITTLYSLNLYQTMSAWDCTEAEGTATLDMDPDIECQNADHGIIIAFSLLSLMLYTIMPAIFSFLKYRNHACGKYGSSLIQLKMPKWEDPHNCSKYAELSRPCYDCEYCDLRQRYSWFYNKYHTSCFNYEYIVFLQKVFIGGIGLFFTNRIDVAMISMIVCNFVFIGITVYFQPYLTDAESLTIRREGRAHANIDRQKCSKKGCGVNNSLDILLLSAEICLCISALLTFNLKQTLNANSSCVSREIVNGNVSLVEVGLSECITKKYPVEDGFIAYFEFTGLIIYIAGYLYVFKFTVVFFYRKYFLKNEERRPEGTPVPNSYVTPTETI